MLNEEDNNIDITQYDEDKISYLTNRYIKLRKPMQLFLEH